MKRKFAVLFTSFIIFLLISCSEEIPPVEISEHNENANIVKLSPESIKEIGLATYVVRQQSFSNYLSIPAKVLTDQDHEALIGSSLPGRIFRVFVNTGEYVRTGQPLMQVEGPEIGEIQAGFLKAKANLNYAESVFNRQKDLFQQNAGSQKAFQGAQAEYEKALAEYNAEDKRIHSVGLLHEEINSGALSSEADHASGMLIIKSPINGVITERNVVIGQYVDAQSNAFRIINLSKVWIDGQIHEKDLSGLKNKGQVYFTSSTNADEQFTGEIFYIGQVVDEMKRTITVRARFLNPTGRLMPQMFGELKIPADQNSSAVVIPYEAVLKEAGEDYVFIRTSDSLYEKRNVICGAEQNAFIEIKAGLKPDDIVAVQGSFYLKSELKKDELGEEEE